jgi:hypothetical protein
VEEVGVHGWLISLNVKAWRGGTAAQSVWRREAELSENTAEMVALPLGSSVGENRLTTQAQAQPPEAVVACNDDVHVFHK